MGTCADAPPDVGKLAKCQAKRARLRGKGKVNADTRHVSRGVMRTMARSARLPPIYLAKCPMWDSSSNSKVLKDLAFLPIHETLDNMVSDGDAESWCSIDGSQEGFRADLEDWGARLGMDVATNLFACIGLWGDSAPFGKRQSLFLILFTVLSGAFRDRYWIVALTKSAVCKCGCFGRCTFDLAFQVIAWSFRALAAGQYPAQDHEGTPFPAASHRGKLAGKPLKLRAACLAKYGDWQWFKQVLNRQGWRGEGRDLQICWICPGTLRDKCPCYDFTLQASWRRGLGRMNDFFTNASFQNFFVSAIFSIPGFRAQMCKPDWMH